MTIRIRNWSKHQHFKDRTPPWIKLYRDILDDPDWHAMSGDDAKLLVGLWLVASEDETRTGALPDIRRLAFRLRITESQLNQGLNNLSHWLERDDIAAISACHRGDAPETETETETEGEAEQEAIASLSPRGGDTPQCPQAEIVALYHELLPANPRMKVWDGARADALRARWREDAKRQSLDYWRRFFAHVAASPFLTGRVEDRSGRPFLPGLDWLVKSANFAKVIENRYHERTAA